MLCVSVNLSSLATAENICLCEISCGCEFAIDDGSPSIRNNWFSAIFGWFSVAANRKLHIANANTKTHLNCSQKIHLPKINVWRQFFAISLSVAHAILQDKYFFVYFVQSFYFHIHNNSHTTWHSQAAPLSLHNDKSDVS